MESDLQRMLRDWDGMAVVCRHDAATDAWIFIALHDDTLGAPVGGTRMKVYASPEEGLRDAQRLARGMTHKWAAIELGFGGGKAVLALSRPLDGEARRGLLERYGHLLNALRGGFATGQDLGTSPEDMLALSRVCSHVHGLDEATGAMRDPGPFTALGVCSGIRAACRHALDGGDLRDRSVLIQGVGGVGAPLARHCAEAGAELLLSDTDTESAERLATELGGRTVAADEAYGTACDVFAPCAVGAILNAASIPRLRCRVVAGAANNQLDEAQDAERLHERGILYAPDYVINAGGALAFGLRGLGERDDAVLRERVRGLGPLLTRMFQEATERNESPLHAAERHIRRVLQRGLPR